MIPLGELKNRAYFTTTIPKIMIKKIKKISKDTRIPISKLVEEAFDDFFTKYKNYTKNEGEDK